MTVDLAAQNRLVIRAQDGDAESFALLVNQHQARLFRVAYMIVHNRADAEDIVQESLITAWRRLHLLAEPRAFSIWLSQITARTATDVLRKQARRSTDSSAMDEEALAGAVPVSSNAPGLSADPSATALVHAQVEALAQALQRISPNNRTCWVLYEIDGRSYGEISTIVGASDATVRGRIARARSAIMNTMQEWR